MYEYKVYIPVEEKRKSPTVHINCNETASRILYSHSGGYEELCLLGYNAV
jgi:hypothetical protein